MSVSQDLLIAYVDGELGERERAELEQRIAADVDLRARVEAHRRLRGRLAGAFAATIEEPLPDSLTATLERSASNLVALSQRRRPSPPALRLAALAASIAAGVLIGIALPRSPVAPLDVDADGVYAAGVLERSLDTQLAADEAGAVRIALTFRAQSGEYCRTFELVESATAGLACRRGDRWLVQTTAATREGEVRMAAAPAVMDAVDAMIDGEPLDAGGERAARERRWRP